MYLEGYKWSRGYNPPGHFGVDIICKSGTPVPALIDGPIQFVGWITYTIAGKRYQGFIVIQQGNGIFIQYGHLQGSGAKVGQHFKSSSIIASSDNTGNSTGPHLHIAGYHGFKNSSKPLSDYDSFNIEPMLRAYPFIGGTDMDTAKVVDDLVIKFVGIDPKKYSARQQKIDYLNGGGDVGQLAEDLIRSKTLFYAADTVVDEIYQAGGYDPGSEVKKAKSAAIGGGFPVDQLIREVVPGGDQQAEIDEALVHLNTAEKILKNA